MKERILSKEEAEYVKKMALDRIVRLGGDRKKATIIADQYFKE